MEPAYANTGDKVKIKLKGNHFTKTHQVLVDGRPFKSTFKSEKEIELDVFDLTNVAPKDYSILVKNANGNTTGTIKFSVVSPFSPLITSVSNNIQPKSKTLGGMIIKGSGFVITSRVYIAGKIADARFSSPTEIVVKSFDASALAVGTYNIQVKNGSRGSNFFPVTLIPIPGPVINYIDPATVTAGSTNKVRLRVTGQRFSTTPRPSLVFKSPTGQDLSSRFKLTSTFPSTTYIYGDLDVSGLGAGKYLVQIKNGTGELSNKTYFTLAPPPPPVATGVNPAFVFRGVASQTVQVVGTNFVTGDLVIFNGNTLSPIPGTAKSNSALEFSIDTRRYGAARDYEVYVKRCLDSTCAKFQVTQKVKLAMKDPPCNALPGGCIIGMLPTGREACDNAGGLVCRPKCTTTAQCTAQDPKAKWTCKAGFCKP